LSNPIALQLLETDLSRQRGNVDVDGEQESGCSELWGLEIEELAVALHVLAKLARSEAYLLEVVILRLLVDAKEPLEAL